MIYLTTFLLSAISMLYEFTLAQLISLFFGSTFEIYAITIGIYTFSLGLGALHFEKIKEARLNYLIFLKTEIALSVVALASPFLIVMMSSSESFEILGVGSKLISFVPVFLCGWLSGIELPCLISLSKSKTDQEVLFVDFAGMFIGSILFSVFLIDTLGPLTLMWALCLINVLIIFSFTFQNYSTMKIKFITMGLGVLIVATSCLIFEREITGFFKRVHGV